MASGTTSVAAAAVSATVTGAFPSVYGVSTSVTWLTDVAITTTTTTQFVATFSVPAPAGGGTLTWSTIAGSTPGTSLNPANLTYAQIETRVMNQLRIPTTNSTEQAKIQAVINQVYRDLYLKKDWWFFTSRTVVNTTARYLTGTINVTNGSTAITFSSPPVGSVAGFFLLIPGDSNDSGSIYRLANSTTLDAAFTGTTNAAASFRLYQASYSLPANTGKVLLVKRYGELQPIRKAGHEEISQFYTSDQTEGKPELWSVWDFATTGDPTTQRQLLLFPYPDKTYRLEVFFKQQLNTELSGSTQPLIPDEYRQILVYGALARGYPIWLNDIERGKFYQSLFNDILTLMTAAQREYAEDQPQLVPQNYYRRFRRRSRTASTLGGWFDRLPSQP